MRKPFVSILFGVGLAFASASAIAGEFPVGSYQCDAGISFKITAVKVGTLELPFLEFRREADTHHNLTIVKGIGAYSLQGTSSFGFALPDHARAGDLTVWMDSGPQKAKVTWWGEKYDCVPK